MVGIENTSILEVPNITFKNVSFSWPGKKENVINSVFASKSFTSDN